MAWFMAKYQDMESGVIRVENLQFYENGEASELDMYMMAMKVSYVRKANHECLISVEFLAD